ncbi:PH domain-containing protein [Luteibacter yeojuensis]|uniref:PH domain-containing protein n=1 Tax=Luteibacter yeojuensis TaxID=345309 RepID=UPI000A7B7FAD|nr:PH domain-containing protein [Luteibacter yeojuensis]
MNQESVELLKRQLGPGEWLAWSGTPRRGLLLRPSDALAIPFSLLWGGFVAFWEYSVLKGGAPAFFGLWGIPFILVGLYMIIGRFFADAFVRSRTAYGVTDQRAIIVSGLFTSEVKSLPLASMADITLSERPDRSGSIQFGNDAMPGRSLFVGVPWPGASKQLAPRFDLISDAKKVYDLILQSRASGTGRG